MISIITYLSECNGKSHFEKIGAIEGSTEKGNKISKEKLKQRALMSDLLFYKMSRAFCDW
jgi:hypothetical protein